MSKIRLFRNITPAALSESVNQLHRRRQAAFHTAEPYFTLAGHFTDPSGSISLKNPHRSVDLSGAVDGT